MPAKISAYGATELDRAVVQTPDVRYTFVLCSDRRVLLKKNFSDFNTGYRKIGKTPAASPDMIASFRGYVRRWEKGVLG